MSRRALRPLVAFAFLGASACRGEDAPIAPRATPASRESIAPLHVDELLAAIRKAEYSRVSANLPSGALTCHDARVRRAAARALGRIDDEHSAPMLAEALADEDGEVVAWSAYGLGLRCQGHEPETVRRLVVRAASLDPTGTAGDAGDTRTPSAPDAIADALARCGSAPAEQTLTAWLDGPAARADSAARSLGRLAGRRHRLDDRTVVALLDAASRPSPITDALYPFGRVESLSLAAKKQLLETANRVVLSGGVARGFAIRALSAAGPDATHFLGTWLSDAHFSASDRSAAATTLGRLGTEGRDALATALAGLASAEVSIDEPWLASNFAPVSALLSALDAPVAPAADALSRLSDLPLPPGGSSELERRLVQLRCDAASILAGTASQSARLVHCDPDPHGRTGALAAVRVLDRGELSGARLDVWKQSAASADPAVRRATLALVSRHPELSGIADVIVSALGAKEPGVVAQAALALGDAPRVASNEPSTKVVAQLAPTNPGTGVTPRPDVVDALARAMDAERPPDQIEPRVALTEAAAALGVLSLKPRVERYCKSDNVTLRRSAETALRELGSTGAACPAPKSGASPSPSPTSESAVTLTFVTDAGRLGVTLDPGLSPLSVARVTDLARAGFYNGIVIHRVTPGFIVQFGDPTGDGSSGSGRPPVPSENSPLEFGALSVGLALGGRDTGSSQVFVTLSAEPHLYGDYPLLGRADPDWANVSPGDVIHSVEIRE